VPVTLQPLQGVAGEALAQEAAVLLGVVLGRQQGQPAGLLERRLVDLRPEVFEAPPGVGRGGLAVAGGEAGDEGVVLGGSVRLLNRLPFMWGRPAARGCTRLRAPPWRPARPPARPAATLRVPETATQDGGDGAGPAEGLHR
jgi:hypothetical protein